MRRYIWKFFELFATKSSKGKILSHNSTYEVNLRPPLPLAVPEELDQLWVCSIGPPFQASLVVGLLPPPLLFSSGHTVKIHWCFMTY